MKGVARGSFSFRTAAGPGVLLAVCLAAAATAGLTRATRATAAEAARALTPRDAGIEVRTRLSADSVTVGERLFVTYDLSFPDSLSFLPPESFDAGNCRLLGAVWTGKEKGGRTDKTVRLEVMTTDLESARVPAAVFRFVTPAGDTLSAVSGDVEAGVRRFAASSAAPKPLKPQWEAPRSYTPLFIAAAALALAAVAVWLFRKWRRREVAAAPVPELPADFVALRALDEIERMNLLEAGELKKHYTLVVDTLRVYLEKRFGVVAMDQTTDEILRDLRRGDSGDPDIEPLLREADLVKFAKHRPEDAAARGLVDRVRAVVARTARRLELAAETA